MVHLHFRFIGKFGSLLFSIHLHFWFNIIFWSSDFFSSRAFRLTILYFCVPDVFWFIGYFSFTIIFWYMDIFGSLVLLVHYYFLLVLHDFSSLLFSGSLFISGSTLFFGSLNFGLIVFDPILFSGYNNFSSLLFFQFIDIF